MTTVRGKAVALAALVLTTGLGAISFTGLSGADDPHAPIKITGDAGFASCVCVRSGTGTQADPYVISDWRIDHKSGTAIDIRDVSTKFFVIRDNTLIAGTGISLTNTGNRGAVVDNTINHLGRGVKMWASSPRIADNTVLGPSVGQGPLGAVGIDIEGGSPVIDGNYIARSIKGIRGAGTSTTIEDNTIIENYDGVFLTSSASAVMRRNVIRLAGHYGLVVERSASATMVDNEVREGQGGIIVRSASLFMEGNTVINQRKEAVRFDDSHVTMLRNVIKDNWRGAHGSTDSDVLIVDNVFTNNQDSGIRLTRSEGRIADNLLELNHVAIRIDDSIITIEDNVMNNNTFGLSIPYGSRQSIPLMSGNIVNGINVDGALVPAEKAIYYKAAGVTIAGRLLDSGHSQGYFGTVTEQGALVIYDSIDITIENNDIEYNHRGITVVNSSFVTIQNNRFRNNHEGVFSEWSRTFIKENDCDIDIDPPQTFCFKAQGGFVSIRSNIIAHVDVGIIIANVMGKPTEGEIADNFITGTRLGLRLEGMLGQSPHTMKVSFNRVEANLVGATLVGFRGTLEGNTFGNNTAAGVQLTARANATFKANKVIFNGRGIVDIDECQDNHRTKCSSGVFIGNRIRSNTEVGISLGNGGSFDGDVVAKNRVGIVVAGSVNVRDAQVQANKNVGLRVNGQLNVHGGNFTGNGADGIRVEGNVFAVGVNASKNKGDGFDVTGRADIVGGEANNNTRVGVDLKGEGHLRHGNFSGNLVAGLRLNGTHFILFDCEISFNFDGIIMAEALIEIEPPRIRVPDVPQVPNPFQPPPEQDPLFMNECNLVKNQRFALSASINSVIRADGNFWGTRGPTFAVPLVPTSNTINAVGLFTPYWRDRAHTQVGFLPTTPFGPDPVI